MKVNKFDDNSQYFLANIIELFPNESQKEKIFRFIYASNYIYDIVIKWCDESYERYLNDDSYIKILSKFDLNKELSKLRENDDILKNIPLHICRCALYNAVDAYKRYLNKISGHPITHLPNNMTMSFSIDRDSFYINNGYVSFLGFNNNSIKKDRVGSIKCQNINVDNSNIYNISLFIDNLNRFFIYYTSIYDKIYLKNPKSEPIGIDLGMRLDGSNTIVCSNGKIYRSPDISHLITRIKFFQSKFDKFGGNDSLYKYKKSVEKMYNVMDNFYNQSSSDIVKSNPEAIILEDNFVSRIKRKNNYIDYGYIAPGKIKNMIIYKAKKYNIPIIIANKNFKSSYICSNCGRIRFKDLKQSKIFKCDYCGNIIDRDINASINLLNIYKFMNSPFNYNDYIKEIIN